MFRQKARHFSGLQPPFPSRSLQISPPTGTVPIPEEDPTYLTPPFPRPFRFEIMPSLHVSSSSVSFTIILFTAATKNFPIDRARRFFFSIEQYMFNSCRFLSSIHRRVRISQFLPSYHPSMHRTIARPLPSYRTMEPLLSSIGRPRRRRPPRLLRPPARPSDPNSP